VLAAKRVALVLEDGIARPVGLPAHFAIVDQRIYEKGSMSIEWLTDQGPVRAIDDTATRTRVAPVAPADDDELRATRRIAAVAHTQRERIAAVDDGPAALDMMAVLEDEVGWARVSGLGFGLVLMHLGGLTESAGGEAEAVVRSAVAALRASVRRGDAVAYTHDDFIVLLPEADTAGAAIAALRAAKKLAAGAPGLPGRPRKAKGLAAWSVGVASCPADGYSREALIVRATAELRSLDRWMRDL
jgi:hypothetical protein